MTPFFLNSVMPIKRMLRGGWNDFVRGGVVSVATVLIMTVTLSIIGTLIFLSALLNFSLDTMRDKIDISVYFVNKAQESDIFAVKNKLEDLPQVMRVTYRSTTEALAAFDARHTNDQLTLKALNQIEGNPFDASLSIKAKDPSEYESIVRFLEASPALSVDGVSIVDRINYKQNKEFIDRLLIAIRAVNEIGFATIIIFAIVSILIAFATIRLAIYTAKDEIAVMRLVGASNAYVQGPFIVAGIITGIIAAVLVLFMLWPATVYSGAKTALWFGGFNLATYYAGNFFLISAIIVGSGIALGAIASILAIRAYLKA